MLDHILTKIPPEFLLLGGVLSLALVLLATYRPHLCFALSVPCYLFIGQLGLSVSATTAMCVLITIIGSILARSRILLGRSEMLLLAIALLMVVSTRYTSNPAYGIDKATLFCFLCVPVALVAPQAVTSVRALRAVAFVTTITLIVFVLASAFARTDGMSFDGRAASLADVTRAGQFFGLAAVVGVLYLCLTPVSIPKQVLWVCLIVLSLVLLLKTGTRAAFLSVVFALVWAYWFVHREWLSWLCKNLGVASAAVFFVALIWLAAPLLLDGLVPAHVLARFTTVEALFENFSHTKIANWQDSTSRALNYFSAIEGMAAHPLQGVGAGGYAQTLGMYIDLADAEDGVLHAYPHNLLLEFGVEQGIPGLLLILLILRSNHQQVLALRSLVAAKPEHSFLITYAVCLYGYGLCVAMSALDIPRMMILWWGMGLLFATRRIFVPLSAPAPTARGVETIQLRSRRLTGAPGARVTST